LIHKKLRADKSGNACYHSVQNLTSFRLLSKNLKINIYKTIILAVVLYRYKNWSLTLRGEHRPKVFEIRMLRRIFGPKRDEVVGGERKLHNEEFQNLYSSANIIRIIKSRRMRWAVDEAFTERVMHLEFGGKARRKETTRKTIRR
jgi:hypothetical protein